MSAKPPASARRITDAEAIRQIHAVLDGTEWDPDTFNFIAGVIEATGREIREPGDTDGADRGPVMSAQRDRRITIIVEDCDADAVRAVATYALSHPAILSGTTAYAEKMDDRP